MQSSKRTLLLAASAALLGTATGGRAHGDKDHPQKAAAAKKEQKDWGIAGDVKAVKRTIEFQMLDTMRFVPDRIEVRLGETVRLVHRNAGKVMHEFVIGTK